MDPDFRATPVPSRIPVAPEIMALPYYHPDMKDKQKVSDKKWWTDNNSNTPCQEWIQDLGTVNCVPKIDNCKIFECPREIIIYSDYNLKPVFSYSSKVKYSYTINAPY